MDHLFPEILLAVVAFTSTNLDDLFLLSCLFVDVEFSTPSIIIGQFIGMSVLVLASVLIAWFAVMIPGGWLALLGLAPLFLGVTKFAKLWQERQANRTLPGGEFVGPEQLNCTKPRHAVWTVMILTIANGGDNLGVYIPLFSVQLAMLPIYLAVFAFMTALWCLLGYHLTNHPLLRERLKRYGRIVVPFVLVAIGLRVLSGAWPLLGVG
jgi:cadmium resistance protein CadD (predicted permease)